jgi:hypothetical protein
MQKVYIYIFCRGYILFKDKERNMSLEWLARSKITRTSKIVNNLPIRLGKFLIIGTWLSKLICWSELESSVIQVLSAPVTALLMEKVLKYAYD